MEFIKINLTLIHEFTQMSQIKVKIIGLYSLLFLLLNAVFYFDVFYPYLFEYTILRLLFIFSIISIMIFFYLIKNKNNNFDLLDKLSLKIFYFAFLASIFFLIFYLLSYFGNDTY